MEQSKLLLQIAALDQKKAITIALVISVLFWFLVIRDEANSLEGRLASAKNDLQTEENKKDQSQKALAKAEEVKAQLAKVAEQYEKITAQLPSDLQGSEVNKAIQILAGISGVNVKFTEPKPLVSKETLEEIPFKLQLEGTFSEVTNFLYNVATAERVMKIGEFILTPATSGNVVTFDGVIIAFRSRKL